MVRTFWNWLLRNKWPIPRRPRHLPSCLPACLSTPSTPFQFTDPCESPSQGAHSSFHCLPTCAWSFISSQIIQFFILHNTLRSFSLHMLKESHLPVGVHHGVVFTLPFRSRHECGWFLRVDLSSQKFSVGVNIFPCWGTNNVTPK